MNTRTLAVVAVRQARGVRPGFSSPPPAPPPETTLLGVGSASTSLVDYPKTGSVTTGDYYVDPNAVSNGVGSFADPFDNLASALSAVSDGQTILVRAGTLTPATRFIRSTNWATGINVFNYGTERPILNGSSLGTGSGSRMLTFSSTGRNEHWKGFELINTDAAAIYVEGQNHMFEDIWVHDACTGTTDPGAIRCTIGGDNNLIQDCAVWKVGDGISTGSNVADCYYFGSSSVAVVDNTAVRCFAANGADDCFDCFRGNGTKLIDCVAYKAGYYWDGTDSLGDGSGFKAGSNNTGMGGTTVQGCIAIACKSEAIKPNSAQVACSFLNNTVVDSDGAGMTLDTAPSTGTHTATNNISLGNTPNVYSGNNTQTIERYNTWNTSGDAGSNADFPITNAQFAAPVSFDWSLGAGSPAIGAGDTGGNLGASTIALEIALEWLAKDLTV